MTFERFLIKSPFYSSIDDIRDEIEKYQEEGKLLTEVFRERQADVEFDRLEQAEIEEKLREHGMTNFAPRKKGRFF